MRLLLIVLQAILVGLMYIGGSVAAGSFTGFGGFGGGPASRAAAVWLFARVLSLGVLFVKLLLPFALVLTVTLFCAFLAGYRFLRWARWVGFVINIVGACHSLFADSVPIQIKGALTVYFLLNSFLFFAMPKRPNAEKSRKVITWAHPVLWISIAIPLILAMLCAETPLATWFVVVLFLILYGIPFVLNFRVTRGITLFGDGKKDGKKAILSVAVSSVVTAIGCLAAPVLAIPVGTSLMLLLFFLEMLFLYPEEYPQRTAHIWLVKLLGKLPEKSSEQASV